MEKTKKKEFIEILYTGYSQEKVFDSNVPDDLKKLDPKATPEKLIVSIGEGMVVSGLDKALEDKELEKEYEIKISAKEAFGERDRNLLKTIPLKVFHEKNIEPKAGMVFAFDNSLAKIVTVSGARVITDFNNPLAGKEITYKFKIVKRVTDEKEKTSAVLGHLFRFVPDFDLNEKEITIRGQKNLEIFVTAFKEKVKSVLDKDLKFEEKKEEKKPEEKSEIKQES